MRSISKRLLWTMASFLFGCSEELMVGANNSSCTSGESCLPCSPVSCLDTPILLPYGLRIEVPAAGTQLLSPTWSSRGGVGRAQTRDGNFWGFGVHSLGPWVQLTTAEGTELAEAILEPPDGLWQTEVLFYSTLSVNRDPRGPLLTAAWVLRNDPTSGCVWPDRDGTEVPCRRLYELLMFQEGTIAPHRLDVCPTALEVCLPPDGAQRSWTGDSVLVYNEWGVYELSLAGDLLWQSAWRGQELGRDGETATNLRFYDARYRPHLGDASAIALDPDRWLLYSSSEGAHYEGSAVIMVERGGAQRALEIFADTRPAPATDDRAREHAPAGLLLPATTPSQYALIAPIEGDAPRPMKATEGMEPETGSVTSPTPVFPDILVARLQEDRLMSAHVLKRQNYSPLRIQDASIADDGTIYVATHSGDQASTLADTLTPLLCRFPVAGPSGCFALSERIDRVAATSADVVHVQFWSGTLARFDLPH